jgi:hypothetical protein
MMTRRLALILAGAFSASVLTAVLAGPADAVCRPYCLDMNKHGEKGDRRHHGHHYGWAKHELHKHHGKHRGHGGHDEPPVTPPPVTQPPVEPPPPPTVPPPCIGC